MGHNYLSSHKFDVLGTFQLPILDAIAKALPGADARYAPMPFGKVVLVVTYPGFENRDESQRKRLVRDSIIASLRINPSEYLSGIHCWTPTEESAIKNAGEEPAS
jgi:hypothetical protein